MKLFNHRQVVRVTGVPSPTFSMWSVCSPAMPLLKPVKTDTKSHWHNLGQVKLIAAVNSLHRLGLTVRRSIDIALTWSHTSDAHQNLGYKTVHVDRPAGGVFTNSLTLCVARPGEQFGTVVAVDPGRPFISVWKELLAGHDTIVIVDCDRVLGTVTDRIAKLKPE